MSSSGRPPYVKHEDANELAVKYADRIKGKTIIITGASPHSLGAAFVEAVAKSSPKSLILVGTSKARLAETVEAVKSKVNTAASSTTFHTVQLDLASQASVREGAAEIRTLTPNGIDALLLNAGVMATPYGLTADGIEQQFGINHIGHFLLGNLLVDKVIAAGAADGSSPGEARIVVTSSDGHRWAPVLFDDLPTFGPNGERYDKWKGYASSKTANTLYALELAERLKSKGVQAFSVQPGFVLTGKLVDGKSTSGISKHLSADDYKLMGVKVEGDELKVDPALATPKTPSEGAATSLYGAFEPSIAAQSGAYLRDVSVATSYVSEWCKDREAAKRLWVVSEELVGQKFDI